MAPRPESAFSMRLPAKAAASSSRFSNKYVDIHTSIALGRSTPRPLILSETRFILPESVSREHQGGSEVDLAWVDLVAKIRPAGPS